MQVEAKKYLYDIYQAALNVTQFTAGKSSEDYEEKRHAPRRRSSVSSRSSVRRWHNLLSSTGWSPNVLVNIAV